MKTRSRIFKYILPFLIVAIGLVGMTGMVRSKTPPEKKVRAEPGTLVEVMPLAPRNHAVEIRVTGTVQPAVAVNIVPQVSGQVVRLGKGFKEGGFFSKGQLLFEVEDVDYRLAVEKSRAEVAREEYDLAAMESQARVARIEWDRVNLDPGAKPNPLVIYEPQLKNARAALAGARADLRQRELDVARTKIYAPFNCRVSAKALDVGQFVTAGQTVATIAGTDAAEIVVPVPLHELQWVEVPRSGGKAGSSASVYLNAGLEHVWQGRIDRSLGEVDAQSRMIRLVVRVEDPYGLKQGGMQTLALSEGLFVDVALSGKTLERVFAIPVSALRHQDTLWMMGSDATLAITPVQVVRWEKEIVLVRGTFDDGQQMVTTQISGAAQGMRLRLGREVSS